MPALIGPVVLSATLVQAQSVHGQPPARDNQTQAFPRQAVSRYAPPVHIQPPSRPGNGVPGPAMAGRASNGRFNSTQNYSYKATATVSKLSDETLAAPARLARNTTRQRSLESTPTPTPAVQRRPSGLQDRIASVLNRQQQQDSAGPTVLDTNEAPLDQRDRRVVVAAGESENGSCYDGVDRGVVQVADNRSPQPRRIKYPADTEIELSLDASFDEEDHRIEQVALAEPATLPTRQSRSNQKRSTYKQSRKPSVTQFARPIRDEIRLDAQPVSVLTSRQDEAANDLRPGPNDDDDFREAFDKDRPSNLRENSDSEIDDFDAFDRDLDEVDADDEDLDASIEDELKRFRNKNRSDDGDDIDEDEEAGSRPQQKSCDQFRNELLGGSIRDIPLDTSSPASSLGSRQYSSISRSWSDRYGNVIANGAMVDLRRGYVLLDSGQKIAYARLSEADWAVVSEFWRMPTVCSAGDRGSVARCWTPQTFTWTAANLCHKTLFFENIQLERYGHSHGPFSQPVASVAHFFASLVTVPYQSAIHPANECQYALGYYRPGNCAPWLRDPIPISLAGASRQALVTTGMAFTP